MAKIGVMARNRRNGENMANGSEKRITVYHGASRTRGAASTWRGASRKTFSLRARITRGMRGNGIAAEEMKAKMKVAAA